MSNPADLGDAHFSRGVVSVRVWKGFQKRVMRWDEMRWKHFLAWLINLPSPIKLMFRTPRIKSPRYDFACLCIYLLAPPISLAIQISLLCSSVQTFFCFYCSIWKHSRAILVRNTAVEALLNWKTRVQKTSTIVLMMITISSFDSCRNPFMWNELICSDDEECMLCGLVFPQSHQTVSACRQQICKTVKLSEGCNIVPGEKKNKKDS